MGQHRRDEARQHRIRQAAAAEPLRPPAPAPVLTAVKFMYSGAVGTAVCLIIALAFIGDIEAYHVAVLGHRLTTAQLSHQRPLIVTLVIVAGPRPPGAPAWLR